MSNKQTKHMLDLYADMADPTLFFTGFFKAPPNNYYNGNSVEVDVKRGGAKIAIVIKDLTVGGRMNSMDLYTNKNFVPPILKEKGVINANELINRQAGQDPFKDVDFQVAATNKALSLQVELDAKIRRTIELEAAQVLQTGKLDLIDENGITAYEMDYKPKTEHFPTAAILWDSASAVPLHDLALLANIIRKDGKQKPDTLIMGDEAFSEFINASSVKEVFNNRRYELGTIAPIKSQGVDGAYYRGTVTVANYEMDIWGYDGFYEDPQTGVITNYLGTNKVIMRASVGRLDATFGGIPNFRGIFPGVLPALPGRFSMNTMARDIFTNTWLSQDGGQIEMSVGSRPLLIPTAIDTFGCLTT
jgi:hypothetical protein